MASVKLTGIKKIYDNKVVAVHDFDLEIKDKEFVVFVGPSGCGKSTTLRMIAGLEEISEGTLEIDGVVVNDLQPKDRDIAMVFQNYALYPHMTVYDNIAFSLRLQKRPEEEIYRKVTNAAEILGITEYLMRKPRALSGGQRQRVAIGRAIVRNAKVFLMDEPLSNLDAKLRNQMRAEIILLRQRIDTTFVYVTHDQTEAMTLGDRIVIMKDGFIQQVGTPQEVFEMPRNIFVAGFIGSPQMNFFEGELRSDANGYNVSVLGKRIALDEQKCELLRRNGVAGLKKVTVGIRPEHLEVDFENGDSSVRGKVRVNEMMGSELHLHVSAQGNDNIVIRTPTVDLSAEHRSSLANGCDISFSFRSKVIQLFDPETEESLLYR
ncbi:MAG: sn-glycerol-3-phosphate ABC transporter ATP-binding protein UgpC [Clostridia bacterium]|nr:sn-glycerol-3-phosphate ABC transporter ATP-binding protein UgpC [Clostridia bacterium]